MNCSKCGKGPLYRGGGKTGLCLDCYRGVMHEDQYGPDNPQWKDQPGVAALHERIYRARGKAKDYMCACGKRAHDWAWKHGTDKYDPANYDPMCRRCHMAYDDSKPFGNQLAKVRKH